MEGVSLPVGEIAATKEPLLAFDCCLLAMAVCAQGEVAMGDEVWDEDLGGG